MLLLLLSVSPSHAYDVTFMSGFDSGDEAATYYGSFEFIPGMSGGATKSDIHIQSALIHDSSNGGTDTSHQTLYIDAEANEQAYYEPAPIAKCDGGAVSGTACDEESDCTGGGDCLREGIGACEDGDYTRCTDDSDCGSNDCRIATSSPFPLVNVYEMTVAANIHIRTTAPSGDRKVLAIIEDDGVVGCNVVANSDRGLELWYGDTMLETPTFVAHQYACANPYEYLPCDENSDCPNTNCGHDTEGTEYFAGLELHEVSYSPAVDCNVYLRGHLYTYRRGYTPGTAPTQIRTFRVGAVDDENATLDLLIDDVVACEDNRCGYGYVATMYPTSDTTKEWATGGTTAGCGINYHYRCIDDYNDTLEAPDFAYGLARILKGTKSKKDLFNEFTQDIGFDSASGMSVDTLELVTFGRDDDGVGTREFTSSLAVATWSLPSPLVSLINTTDNVDRQLNRLITKNLTAGSGGYFQQSDINSIQASLLTSTATTQGIHVGALVVYAHVMRPGDPLPDVIPDDNYGTDDGMITIVAMGDSTTNQTLGGVCSAESDNAGDKCTWDWYCSWEDELKDQPSGGCNGDDNMCHSCNGRRGEVPGGAGFLCDDADPSESTALCRSVCDDNPDVPCDEDADCGTTCVKNECTDVGGECGQTWCCSKNLAVPCATSADCEALLGCASDATCVDSCLNGTCPPPNAWISRLKNHVYYDNLIQCAQGATGSVQMDQKWDNALVGLYAGYAGFGTACTVDSNCALVPPSPSVCRSNGYCSNCAVVEGIYAPGDLYIPLIGVNDSNTAPHAPNCLGPFAGIGQGIAETWGGYPVACSPPTQVNCDEDADCVAAVHAASKCIGRSANDGTLCTGTYGGYGVAGACTVFRLGCNTDADCPAALTNGTCSTDESWYTYRGSCGCSSDAQCQYYNAGLKCVNNVCRRACDDRAGTGRDGDHVCVGGTYNGQACNELASLATECPGGSLCKMLCGFDGGCKTTDSTNACWGTCTYPSAAKSCTVDANCTSIDVNWMTGIGYYYFGNCVGDPLHCECNGPNSCPMDSTCHDEYVGGWLDGLKFHHAALNRFKSWQDDVASSSMPRILFMTVPDTRYGECWMTRGDKQYINRANAHLMQDARCATGSEVGKPCHVDSDCPGSGDCQRRFTHVVDTAHEFSKYPKSDMFPPADFIHFSAYAAEIIGDRVGEWISGWHTCALDAGTPQQRPQWFCRYANDTWTSTTCTLDTELTDCAAAPGSVCQVRVCASEDDCPGASTCNLTF